MGKSIRSKKIRKNKAALKVRYAARFQKQLEQTVQGLPVVAKEEMLVDATEGAAPAEAAAPQAPDSDGDVGMDTIPIISKSAIKKKRTQKKLKQLKKKGINPKKFNWT
eukprot:comp9693_c0_seq1/m.4675 comp9693_c0_seq1/g.4675  ORF comp9693_c0_seq1/g.4675 comp9693_c0_seq1/m.4675 type:complete len:108 (-) comp9693_c0_seq1:150-473(-)